MAVQIGAEAPDFELRDQNGATVKLSGFRGERAVAVVFYPFAFTGVCEGELCALRDDHSVFTDAGVQVLAVSCDAGPSLKRWAEEQGFDFPMLSDFWPHGEVARSFGVFNEAIGCANRGTFLVGTDGTVVDAFESPDLGTARDAGRYQEALSKL
jgi:peroxiredoxin